MAKINQEEYKVLKAFDNKWKWIARIEGGAMKTFISKPFKNMDFGRSGSWDIKGNENHAIYTTYSDLFQFIQWEDEEPYNIAELIEEYEYHNEPVKLVGDLSITQAKYDKYLEEHIKELEKESEETEVKKNLEWLKEEIEDKYVYHMKSYNGTDWKKKVNIELDTLLNLINQLDEPEVLLQEENINIVLDDLKEHIKEQQSLSQNVGLAHTSALNDTHYRQYDYVLECINEYEPSEDLQSLLVPKQELPVIPKFVADFIKETKKQDKTLVFAITHIYDKNEIDKSPNKEEKRIFQWMELGDNEEVFARAWLDGFMVETEQRYYVMNNDNRMMLVRMMDGKTITEADPFKLEDMYEVEKKSHRLTEQEIKDYDERYWAFRKPVEELEE